MWCPISERPYSHLVSGLEFRAHKQRKRKTAIIFLFYHSKTDWFSDHRTRNKMTINKCEKFVRFANAM
jgi:hypothetical protein